MNMMISYQELVRTFPNREHFAGLLFTARREFAHFLTFRYATEKVKNEKTKITRLVTF